MEPTDIELMLRMRDGDLAAFRQLVERYRGPLFRFFAAVLPDRSRAEDCVQETFLRLWLGRCRYEPAGRFSSYLFQIGRHYWLNERKKLGREVSFDGTESADQPFRLDPEPVSQPERMLLDRDRDARIRSAIRALPEHYRIVFELCHVEGWKYAEIASRLGIPVGTVKSRMAEAVRRLREALSDAEEGC